MQLIINSLKNQKEFDLVNHKGTKYYSDYFILVISPTPPPLTCHNTNSDTDTLYYGIKVGRKYSKKAVIRNKVKRRVRHLIRILSINKTQGFGTIIIPRKDFHTANFLELQNQFEKFYSKYQKLTITKNT